MQKTVCEVHFLGLVPYKTAWQLQEELAAEVAMGSRPPTLLLLEHPHTYTFGRRGSENNLVWTEREIAQKGIDIEWVDRGGDVTYHGPGQLVGYPLLPLETAGLHVNPCSNSGRIPRADYIGYLRKLEATIIQSLAMLGVEARAVDGLTGVWVNIKEGGIFYRSTDDHGQAIAKIAAIGVKVDVKGVTRHGFALNVDPEMSYWDGIIACGLDGYEITCLSQLMPSAPAMDTVIESIVKSFGQIFAYRMQPSEESIFG